MFERDIWKKMLKCLFLADNISCSVGYIPAAFFVFLNLGMRNELLHFKYPPNTRLDIHPSSTLNRNYLPACKSYC